MHKFLCKELRLNVGFLFSLFFELQIFTGFIAQVTSALVGFEINNLMVDFSFCKYVGGKSISKSPVSPGCRSFRIAFNLQKAKMDLYNANRIF